MDVRLSFHTIPTRIRWLAGRWSLFFTPIANWFVLTRLIFNSQCIYSIGRKHLNEVLLNGKYIVHLLPFSVTIVHAEWRKLISFCLVWRYSARVRALDGIRSATAYLHIFRALASHIHRYFICILSTHLQKRKSIRTFIWTSIRNWCRPNCNENNWRFMSECDSSSSGWCIKIIKILFCD